MTAQTGQGSQLGASQQSGFGAGDWATVIQGAGQGAAEGFKSAGQGAATAAEAKEMKRRTYAELLKNALKRDLAMYRADTGHQDDMSSMQGDALQQVARGFVDSLRGIQTSRR